MFLQHYRLVFTEFFFSNVSLFWEVFKWLHSTSHLYAVFCSSFSVFVVTCFEFVCMCEWNVEKAGYTETGWNELAILIYLSGLFITILIIL